MKVEKKKFVLATTLGSLVALIGIILATSANFTFDLLLRTQMVISPNSANYPFWVDLPVPITTSMYLYHVKNSKEFSEQGEKPELVEIGPYVFDEYHHKTDLVWNSNETVTYKQIRTFKFNQKLSNGNLDDLVTILNIPAATVGATALKQNNITQGAMNVAFKILNEKLFVSKSVGEILFDGYKDPLLTAATFIEKFKIPIPGIMDRFGFYYGRNETDWWDGVFNMFTGHNNIHKLGQIAQWNYSNHLDYFSGHCGDVKGAGDFFPPYMPFDSVELFSNDLCRPIELSYDSWSHVKGVPGKRYQVESSYFANSSVNKANYCFENGPEPLPSGVFNASACRFGAPIFMSQPHFYQADPYYADQLATGSANPAKDKHETAFIVESQAGIPISVTARFQLNALVNQLDHLDMFKNVPDRTFFPVVWFESKFELADSMVAQIWLLSHLHMLMVFVGLLMGIVGLGVAIGFGVCYTSQKRQDCNEQYHPIVDHTHGDTESE